MHPISSPFSANQPLTPRNWRAPQLGLSSKVLLAIGGIVFLSPISWSLHGIFRDLDINSIMLLGFTAVSAIAYIQAVRWLAFSVTPFIFVLLFLVSYPARVPAVERNYDLYTISGGSSSVGSFAFDLHDYIIFYTVSLVGLAGLFVGMGIALRLNRSNKPGRAWVDRCLLHNLTGRVCRLDDLNARRYLDLILPGNRSRGRGFVPITVSFNRSS